jgi:hypothetical protein
MKRKFPTSLCFLKNTHTRTTHTYIHETWSYTEERTQTANTYLKYKALWKAIGKREISGE